jgi:cytochrome c
MGRWIGGVGLFSLIVSAALAQSGAGDAELGRQVWERTCVNCHAMDFQNEGPMHRGVYGRKAGSLADFDYSPAVKDSNVVWDETTLERWLTDPQALIPGQKMNYKLPSATDRANVIAYLKRESGK